jgi:hypothetical protein
MVRAETFVDPQIVRATAYRASGHPIRWEAPGAPDGTSNPQRKGGDYSLILSEQHPIFLKTAQQTLPGDLSPSGHEDHKKRGQGLPSDCA